MVQLSNAVTQANEIHTFQINALIQFLAPPTRAMFRTTWLHHQGDGLYMQFCTLRPVMLNLQRKCSTFMYSELHTRTTGENMLP